MQLPDGRRNDFHSSLWAVTANPFPERPRLTEAVDADVAIVGGGFTGLRTGLELAIAGTRTVVLEAHRTGYGASGRTGGQCNPILRMTPAAAVAALGRPFGENLVQATIASAGDLFQAIARHGIDCDAVQKGWLQVAHTAAAARELEALRSAWTAAGADIGLLDRDSCAAWSGSRDYVAGLFHPTAGHVQPLSLARGFASAFLRHGGELYEDSMVTAVERTGGRWQVRTRHGEVRAANVVIATNGYTGDLIPGLRQSILPMVSLLAATAPLNPAQRAEILPRLTTIADTRRAIFYARYDRDHRLAIGCLGSDPDNPQALGGMSRLRAGAERIFPALKGIAWDYAWGGRIAVTRDFLPHLHEPAPGLHIGLGFNGRGVAMSSVMGRALAARILGASAGSLPFPVTPLKSISYHRLLTAVLPLAGPVLSAADALDRMRR